MAKNFTFWFCYSIINFQVCCERCVYMQISSINPSFNGRRDNIDMMINMDDKAIRDVAYLKTASGYNHEKSRKITNALFYSAPLAAGLATAVLSKGGNAKIFSTKVTGLAARAANGFKVAAGWTAALAAIDLLGYGKKKLADNSPEVRQFDKEHPLMSMGLMLGAAIAAVIGVQKGAIKLEALKSPKFLQNIAIKTNKFLNNNKTVQSMKGSLLKLAEKTHPALKDIGKTALEWSPTALLFGGLFHSIHSANRENRDFYNNYTELKEKQAALTQARLRELSMQNDFLMQDAHNREDIALLNNPMSGLEEAAEQA